MSDKRDLFFLPRDSRVACTLHVPENEEAFKKPYPFVVQCHGFLGTKSGRFRYQVQLSEKLAEKGIASIRFDYRGSGESLENAEDVGFHDAVFDLQSVLSWAFERTDLFDQKSAILWGRSFGGMVVANTLNRLSQNPLAVILQAPMFDAQPWIQALNRWNATQSATSLFPQDITCEKGLYFYRGEPLSDKFINEFQDILTEKSLKNFPPAIPLLLISHEADQVIGVYHTDQYKAILRDRSGFSLLNIEGADHEITNYTSRMSCLQQTVEWIVGQVENVRHIRGGEHG